MADCTRTLIAQPLSPGTPVFDTDRTLVLVSLKKIYGDTFDILVEDPIKAELKEDNVFVAQVDDNVMAVCADDSVQAVLVNETSICVVRDDKIITIVLDEE